MDQERLDAWQVADASLFSASLVDRDYRPLDVSNAASVAMEALGIRAPNRDAYVVPVFDADDPELTDEYVLYRPDREQVGWYDTEFGVTGTERFLDVEEAARTELGHRLRGWLRDDLTSTNVAVAEEALPPTELPPRRRLSPSDRERVLDDLADFVRAERAAERDRNWDAYAHLELSSAIRRDRVVGPFMLVGEREGDVGDPVFRYQYVDGDVSIRSDRGVFPGDRAILDADIRDDRLPIEVDVRDVSGPHVTLRPAWSTTDSQAALADVLRSDDTDVWLADLLNPVPFQRRLDAIERVRGDDRKRGLLTGTRTLEFAVNRHASLDTPIELNDYQERALLWADAARDLVCIHGPPGTGKTRTLTAYVAYAVRQGHSVLVTAHSNQAVDNLLVGDSALGDPEPDTLHALAQADELSIARVGDNSRNPVVRERYANASIADAGVVAATTNGAAAFDRDAFDVAVVDEATQASRPATAIVLDCARKLVLAGDHKQLPPYCADETMADEALHASLFEYLLDRYGDDLAVVLREQYRMHESIAAFPNRTFYDGLLETADRNRAWTVADRPPVVGVDVAGEERRDAGQSVVNPAEAAVVADHVAGLVDDGLAPEDVCVIAAYRGQVYRVRDVLAERGLDAVTVNTVDAFQGGERDAVVVSFVRSNPENRSGFLTFPEEGPRRLNVALTRARKHLALVGDWETLGTTEPNRTPAESCADLYASLADHLRDRDRMDRQHR